MNETIHQTRIACLGVDLAKNVFHVCGMDQNGKVVLEKKYGAERLEAAAQCACQHGQPRYMAIEKVLEQGREQTLPRQLELSPAYAHGRYLCAPAELMTS